MFNQPGTWKSPRSRTRRRGSVLVVVLIVVALLSLGAWTFATVMITETSATNMYGRRAQTRALADSGVEAIAALLGDELDPNEISLYHDVDKFHAVIVIDDERPAFRGRYSIVAAVESDLDAKLIRFGLIDESSRLNLNTILELDLPSDEVETLAEALAGDESTYPPIEASQRELLMGLPEMTEEIADCILDWIDDDDDPREFGAESEYYDGLDYPARNGPIESIDELLKVKGVESWMLFGEDANRNGLLDANEDDGEARPPLDNADGVLTLGWNSLLCVHSREVNLRADGDEKINLNQGLLTELFDELEEEFDEETAIFVVAFRMFGSSADPATGDWPQERDGSVTKGGMDLSGGYRIELNSLYELVGITVEPEDTDGVAMPLLMSPWSGDPGDMADYLPEFIDNFTVTDDPYIAGRININQARREVLYGVPGMDDDLLDAIMAARKVDSKTGEPGIDDSGARATTGWLVIEGLIDLEGMRELDPFLTTRGAVFRMQILGYFDAGGPFTRLEAVIDASEDVPKVTFLRDLTELGKGYSYQLLVPE